MEIWPNFFIVGAEKSGTTSLYEYLKNIPGIYLSPIKEPNYFTSTFHPERLFCAAIQDKENYLELFSGVKDEVAIGEASPFYLVDPETPNRIHEIIPNAKIIMILRDPLARALSSYYQSLKSGWETKSFFDALKNAYSNKKNGGDLTARILIEGGFYSEQVKRYFDIFGKNQVLVIIFEEFIQDTKNTIFQILDFLEVKTKKPIKIEKIHNPVSLPKNQLYKNIVENAALKKIALKIFKHGTSKKIRDRFLIKEIEKPQIKKAESEFLKNLYYKDMKKLEKILGRSLPWEVVRE